LACGLLRTFAGGGEVVGSWFSVYEVWEVEEGRRGEEEERRGEERREGCGGVWGEEGWLGFKRYG